jgi:hypothetical protein
VFKSGSRYRIKSDIMAVLDGQTLVTIPEGSVAHIKRGPLSDGPKAEVQVEYESRTLIVFAVDLRERGELIAGDSKAG